MNAYQPVQQVSGIQLPKAPSGLLYEPHWERPRWSVPQQDTAIFECLEKQMAEFAVQHRARLDELRKHYVLPGDSSVIDFLSEHRTIPEILLNAAPQLRSCFGADAVLNLRAPIDEAGSRTLYAVVIWSCAFRDVRNALDRFDSEWWLAHARQAGGHLVFTYELV